MPPLTGGTARVDLGRGYALIAPGLRGTAERIDDTASGMGARETRASDIGTTATPLLDDALARAELTTVATVEIAATPVPGASAVADLRDPRGDDALELEVPDLGPEVGQVVLAVDEVGGLTWHFALEGEEIQPPSVRGAGERKRFRIRRYVPTAPAEGAPGEAGPGAVPHDRALFGATGRKLLKVLVYPITDRLLARPAAEIAEHWEAGNRAYGLRSFTPTNYRQSTATPADRDRLALTADDVRRLAAGPALLYIHGTFSTAHGAFNELSPKTVGALDAQYGGRVFAFNHYSLSHDPAQNVRWLTDQLRALAPDVRLTVDIVCHSRGGLVARTLAEGGAVFGIDTGQIEVRRIAFVAAPNKGTVLAQPDYMVDMIDRLTTALNLVPAGGVADYVEGLLIAVKIIGHGALKGLVGLQSMNPDGEFLRQLNAGGQQDAQYFAIAADYTPAVPGLRAITTGAINAVVDRVFGSTANDLVVPEEGVYASNGCGGFPIAVDARLRIPASAGVMHTTMFGHADVGRQLTAWLT